jgi:hypothetical protein
VTYAVAPWRVAGELVYGALVDEDRPRLLARRSEFAYTDVPALSLPGEPEAISESEQRRQTLAARRKRDQQQRQTWLEARARIVEGVTLVRTSRPPMPQRIMSSVRVIERTISRVDAELRGG